jgi:iron(III) transport system substrate-binding protein
MPTRRDAIAAACLAAAASCARPTAERGAVRVHATTDRPAVQPLIDDFERLHARLRVDYVQLGSVELYRRCVAADDGGADVLWSSAMDLQIKLVNDGHAARHESPHAAQLPRWAVWKHEAYATTYEPVGWAHHRALLPDAPRDHASLAALLHAQQPRLRRRIATYDVERAGVGYLIAVNDALASPQAWELLRLIGRCRPELHADTQAMLDSVADGRALLAHNVLGSYAEPAARSRRELAVVYPSDYTLVVSRVAFVARRAPNPDGARRWLDHLLSPRGQRLLADAGLYAVRSDVASPRSAAAIGARLGEAARPVALGPGLLANLDDSRRRLFLKRWNEAVRQGA